MIFNLHHTLLIVQKHLYIGYVISDYPLYPAGCDNGPALDGLGNMVVWCNTNGCGELTLAEAAADNSTFNNNWMVAVKFNEFRRALREQYFIIYDDISRFTQEKY